MAVPVFVETFRVSNSESVRGPGDDSFVKRPYLLTDRFVPLIHSPFCQELPLSYSRLFSKALASPKAEHIF